MNIYKESQKKAIVTSLDSKEERSNHQYQRQYHIVEWSTLSHIFGKSSNSDLSTIKSKHTTGGSGRGGTQQNVGAAQAQAAQEA